MSESVSIPDLEVPCHTMQIELPDCKPVHRSKLLCDKGESEISILSQISRPKVRYYAQVGVIATKGDIERESQ